MTDQLEYRLAMAGRNGYLRHLRYRPHVSELLWEDTGERVSLAAVGMDYAGEGRDWPQAFAASPANPASKSRSVRVLKIQMGLKCNYACAYCNQASQPHEIQGNLDDVEAFLGNLPNWLNARDGKGLRIEFWGGEPFVYWKALRVLGGRLRAAYPLAEFNIITNGSLIDDEKIDWLERLGCMSASAMTGPVRRLRVVRTRSMIRYAVPPSAGSTIACFRKGTSGSTVSLRGNSVRSWRCVSTSANV